MEPPPASTAAATHAALKCGMSVAIVGRTFRRVAENFVGLAQFLELVFCFAIVGIFIRMKLNGQLAVTALDLIVRRCFLDTEDLVVIALATHFCGPLETITDEARMRRSLRL